jgi:transcriptional regulator with XRE-family HTH domain
MAKPQLRERARALRAEGMSLTEICAHLSVAKSTASLWVRDVTLGDEQIARLAARDGRDAAGRAKFSRTMREKREERHAAVRRAADDEYEQLRQSPDFLLGLGLYIGEGSKRTNGALGLTNCDPRVIRKALRFYEIIGAERGKVRCLLQLHPGSDEVAARAYWQAELGITPDQFMNILWKVSTSSTGRAGKKQPHGICTVYAHSMPLWLKVHRWMELALQETD